MMDSPAPVGPPHRFWSEWAGIIFQLSLVPITCVLSWQFPGKYQRGFNGGLFGVGLAFDVLSAFCYTLGLVTRRDVSGVPIVGLMLYAWFWLALPTTIILPTSDNLVLLWLRKLVDLVALIGLHLLFHLPFEFLQRRFPPLATSTGKLLAELRPVSTDVDHLGDPDDEA